MLVDSGSVKNGCHSKADVALTRHMYLMIVATLTKDPFTRETVRACQRKEPLYRTCSLS